jgi:5-methylcytosine-specific restriction protein B
LDFYLIVDEINRGDLPRIFGELLTVLEADKRNRPVLLSLSGAAFRVPSNVFLIGTMNTADRSIALLDAALRRRFGFIELLPDSGTLRETVLDGLPLGLWLDALNRRVIEHLGADARNRQIGHSYFLQRGVPLAELGDLARVLREDIVPLLQEYCYEDYGLLEKILGSGLVDIHTQRVADALFEPARVQELLEALLATCPELNATRQVVAAEAGSSMEEADDEPEGESPRAT